jgi:hypothetical protein
MSEFTDHNEENNRAASMLKPAVNNAGLTSHNLSVKEPVHLPNENNNTIPPEVVIKKPATSLLQTYKQTWKAAKGIFISISQYFSRLQWLFLVLSDHFQRYSDVRKRDERPTSVIDLANQAHVLQKVNGWKIYHLSSQIEDMVS